MFKFPAYPKRPHKSGQARIRILGKDYYLGQFGSPESKQEYARLASTLANTPEAAPAPKGGLLVNELCARFLAHAAREHGADWLELRHYARIAKVLDRTIGSSPVADVDARALDMVRQAMLSGSWLTPEEKAALIANGKPVGWARSWANHQITRTRTIFRWAESQGFAPRGTWEHLRSLPGIRRTAQHVRHSDPRRPTTWEQVEPTSRQLPPVLRDAVLVLWFSGMRPSELLSMRAGDVVDGIYRPRDHKTRYRGDERAVALGPKALDVIAPWLSLACRIGPDAMVFPLPTNPMRGYGICNFGRHIRSAACRAKVESWTPYQCRHAAKQRFTREAGLDAARAALGQSSLGATNLYAREQDLESAKAVAAKCG